MKVIVLTNYSLSSRKGAAYSRIFAYSDALKSNMNFEVIELDRFIKKRPQPSDLKRNENDGMSYLTNNKSGQNKLYKVVFSMFDFISAFKTVNFINKNYNPSESRILLYSSNFFLFFFSIFYLGKLNKYKIIIEKNEIEIGKVQNLYIPSFPYSVLFICLWPIKWILALFIDLMVYLSDGVIVISTNLERKYSSKKNVWRIPILVNLKRFNKRKDINNKENFIYMGAITHKKDALFKTIEAIVLSKHKLSANFSFEIIGDGNKKVLNELKALILKLGLKDIVKIKPSIPSEKVSEVLMSSNFGMLIRENNKQNKYGFSTKLAEYVAAGLFVISSNTSDNLLFLDHMENSFIVDPEKKKTISEAFIYCSNMSDQELNKINERNYSIAQKKFNAEKYRSVLLKVFN
ncbi:MAG: hypothetical protein COA32_13070 [Fluviicola sp.]|nr:MAG: hypothetical protein COA32_13070 [Fluviicola sp.]